MGINLPQIDNLLMGFWKQARGMGRSAAQKLLPNQPGTDWLIQPRQSFFFFAAVDIIFVNQVILEHRSAQRAAPDVVPLGIIICNRANRQQLMRGCWQGPVHLGPAVFIEGSLQVFKLAAQFTGCRNGHS